MLYTFWVQFVSASDIFSVTLHLVDIKVHHRNYLILRWILIGTKICHWEHVERLDY